MKRLCILLLGAFALFVLTACGGGSGGGTPGDTYTVTFDSNGGSSVPSQEINAGDKATEPADPTQGGFDFVEWRLDGVAYDFDTPVIDDITLVADWIADCVPSRQAVAGETEIFTAEDLYNMRGDLTANYILMANIDLSAYADGPGWEPIGYNPVPSIGADDCLGAEPYFTGKFDGNDCAIINLTIDRPTEEYVGLFGNTCDAELSNIALEHVSIAGLNAGGIVGYMEGASEIKGSHVTGNITAYTFVGGIAGGVMHTGTIRDSHSAVNITAENNNVGGIAGHFEGASIENSHSTGDITANENVGGIAGYISHDGTIRGSHSTGDITADGNKAGGIVGEMSGSSQITGSYSTGDISADAYVGGIAGEIYGMSSIESSHSTGIIAATLSSYAGGIAGKMGDDSTNTGGSIKNSYSTGVVTANSNYAGGIAGEAYNDSSIEGSYSTGDISGGGNYAGGIVGNLNKSSITNSYSTANVTAENERAGGIAGNAVISSITKSYSTGIITATGYGDAGGIAGAIDNGDELTACAAINPSVSGTINAGRIVGSNYGVISSSYARSDMLVNGSPVSSNDATSTHGADQNAGWFEVQGNYEAMGWDFTDVWTMDTNISNYPVLKWQE